MAPNQNKSTLDLKSADFLIDAHETAVLRIADMLRHPDDLTNKLGMLRKKVAMERASIEAQLKTVMEVQLDSMQKGIDSILSCQRETQNIRDALQQMDNLCSDEQNSISNYQHIRKSLVEQFRKVNEQMTRTLKFLEEDLKKLIGPAENLLLIHHNVQKLSSFRSKTIFNARGSSTDVINTLNAMFKRLEQIEYRFDLYIWDLAKNTIELAKQGFNSAIIRLIKLIEFEERLDELAAQEEISDAPETQEKFRRIKGYRIKFFDCLRETIAFDINKRYLDNNKELVDVLNSFTSIFDTLAIVRNNLVPLFPKRYNIFHFYVLEYHRAIYDLINQMTSGELDPPVILKLTAWVRDYYQSMSSKLDVNEEILEPKLLDGKEQELMETYVRLVRTKLAEWLTNILSGETLEFLERKQPPEMDTSGQYLLTGSVIIFQMFNQQLDVAAPASKGQLLYEIVIECLNTLENFQNAWLKVLDSEYTKFVNKANDLSEGLVEYTMALANDCHRSTEFSETIISRLETLCDDSIKQKTIDRVQLSLGGFVKITKRSQQVLLDIVMSDVSPAYKVMHCDQWYEQDIMKLIVGTFEDYCEDFQKHMSDYMFNKLTTELIERFVVAWLETFRNKNAKFKMPTATDRMKQDMETCTNFFAKSKSAKRVTQSLEIVQKLIALIESNPRVMYLDLYSLWKSYPDVPFDYVEKVLSKRDDLDKSQVKELIETAKQKTSAEKALTAKKTRSPTKSIIQTARNSNEPEINVLDEFAGIDDESLLMLDECDFNDVQVEENLDPLLDDFDIPDLEEMKSIDELLQMNNSMQPEIPKVTEREIEDSNLNHLAETNVKIPQNDDVSVKKDDTLDVQAITTTVNVNSDQTFQRELPPATITYTTTPGKRRIPGPAGALPQEMPKKFKGKQFAKVLFQTKRSSIQDWPMWKNLDPKVKAESFSIRNILKQNSCNKIDKLTVLIKELQKIPGTLI